VFLACPRKQEILHALISFLLFLAEEAAQLQFRNAIGHLRRSQPVTVHHFSHHVRLVLSYNFSRPKFGTPKSMALKKNITLTTVRHKQNDNNSEQNDK
jgi:hypothetical protein